MKKHPQNKLLILIAIIAIMMPAIFVAVQIPTVSIKTKNLPVAIVDEDSSQLSKKTASEITKITNPMYNDSYTLQWTRVKSRDELNKMMSDQMFYAAIIIPKDFGKNIMSLATADPKKPVVETVINQAKSYSVSIQTSSIVKKIGEKLSQTLSTQILTMMADKKIPVVKTNIPLIMSPLEVTSVTVHEVGDFTTPGASFFQPIWISSLVVAIFTYLWKRKFKYQSSITEAKLRALEVVISCISAFTIGFFTVMFEKLILNYQFTNETNVVLFVSIASFAFISIILGVMSWIGVIGSQLFTLLMFVALPLMSLVPENTPQFYNDYIIHILPMRFLYDGVREILFYNGAVFNSSTNALILIALVGVVLIFGEISVVKIKQNRGGIFQAFGL